MYPEDDNRHVIANTASGSYSAVFPVSNVEVSSSINSSVHPEIVVTQDPFASQRLNSGMSSIRRFFCLFISFDFLFTTLMWLICIMLNGDTIWIALNKEVYHYNVETSLFDIVLVALCRFVVLMLFYGLISINHWFIIALSTAGTCVFLISKVFLFNWQSSPQPVFQVLLILTSFILSWGEAWFLDFRVIPQEFRANQVIIATPDSERTPLIRSYVQGLPSVYTESIGNFYSPQASPTGSEDRFGEQSSRTTHLTEEQVVVYKTLAIKILPDSWKLLYHEGWKVVKRTNEGDIVSSLIFENRKIYKLTAVVNAKPRLLLDELFYRVENMPTWDTALAESRRLEVIDDHTDITYQVSAPAAGGLVTSREFISLRTWKKWENCFLIANIGIDYAPINDKYIRGLNGLGCWAIHHLPNESNKCRFEWVLNSDLKAWFPTRILEPAYASLLFDYAKNLRKHLKKYEQL